MKIGILTFHRSINYGAFMQAYCLSKRIQEDTGNDVEIIDYEPVAARNLYYRHIVLDRRDPLGVFHRLAQRRVFRRSLRQLPLSNPPIVSRSHEPLFDSIRGQYDVIVVGSDAVWNWIRRGFPNAYFLHDDLGCTKMSYAASAHGMEFAKVTDEQRAFIGQALREFKYIGVRDSATESFICTTDQNLVVHHNCDPTILLDMGSDCSRLRDRLQREYRLNFEKPMIGIMSNSHELGRRIRRHYGSKYQVVALYMNNTYADVFLYNLDPFEWAQVFSFFTITFTQYYHGMLLSLKNATPVIALDFWRYSLHHVGKMQDMLSRIGLDRCYFAEKAMEETDWSRLFHVADGQIASPPKEEIRTGLESEAASYESFRASLTNVVRDVAGVGG